MNAATAPETWQTYDIVFRAARFDAEGGKTDDAGITVVWNGPEGPRRRRRRRPRPGAATRSRPRPGAIRLQDHGNKVRFRNLWIEPLG
ncbi:family 16 glycoside hydrolase [Streptomyces sp. BoleA5]|uniref:family 16 glycoside hydrolase n=1 Tax=Streptomyces sp. BoleA5 TaxID=1157637 RepID=UPI003B63E04A